ncbi:MAG: ABC transporter substrate-binding protein [Candidatus Thermoplasmatota archaeon]
MRTKVYIIIVFLLISSINITGCLNQINDKNENNNIKTINVGLTDKIFGFYPYINNYDISTMEINFNIYDGLVDFDENFRIIPRLAKSWNNPDQNTWRFYLREEVKFHNNDILTAEDVKYSIEFIKKNSSNVLKDLISSVADVIVIDNNTIDIKTDGPNPILLNKLVDIPIISKQYLESLDNLWPIGTSAYKLVKYSEDKTIILEKFENYWGDKVEIEKALFYIIENDEVRKNKLISGEINIAENILPIYLDEIINNKKTSVKTISSTTVVYLSFDFRETNSTDFKEGINPISDIRVRKAIYHAIDTKSIIKNVKKGFAEPASQFLSPLIFGYNPNIEILEYNQNESIRLLKEAGYEKGFNLTLDCAIDWYDDLIICEEITRQLAPLINVTLNPLSVEQYYDKILNRKSAFYIIGWIPATGDGGEIFDYILRSVDEQKGFGTYNLGYYSNQSIDNISDKIMISMDPEIRLDYMQRGFKIAMDDIACIPLFINVLNYGLTDDIEWTPRSDMDIRLENIKFKS